MVVDVFAVGCWMLVHGRVFLDDVYDLLFDGICCWMIAGAVAVGCWMLVYVWLWVLDVTGGGGGSFVG